MKRIYFDFVIDATESAAVNLPAVHLFCDDLIRKGFQDILQKFYYGITVFYGKEKPAGICRFEGKMFTDHLYEFHRVFEEIESGYGSMDGIDDIIGGIQCSAGKLREKNGLKVMLVFSDSYVKKGGLKDIGIVPAQKVHLYLASKEELGDVEMTPFWGMPMLNGRNRVDHRLRPKLHKLSDIFDVQKREKQMNEIIADISEAV